MPKYVIETIEVIRHKYYVDAPDPEWACDGIVMGELEPFSTKNLSEDFLRSEEVNEFPVQSHRDESINSAVMVFDSKTNSWNTVPGWEFVKE